MLSSIESILSELVSFNSVFPKEEEAVDYLAGLLGKLGFSVALQPVEEGRANVLAERGRGEKSILLYGHSDTVAPSQEWKGNPFNLKVSGDKLTGLGACDMKGGLAVILKAAEKKQPKNHKLKIAFCVDEENVSQGAMALRKQPWLDDVEFVVSAEPGKGKKTCGGANVITLGRRGHVTLRLEVPGRSGHGAKPGECRNAIEDAARIIAHLSDISLMSDPKLGRSGMMIRACFADSRSFTVPDKATLIIERSTVFPETAKSALVGLRKFVDGLYAAKILSSINGKKAQVFFENGRLSYLNPYITEASNGYVKLIKRLIRERFHSLLTNYGLSVADDNIFATMRNIPTITIGPAGGNLHQAQEWVSRRSLSELTDVYQNFLEAL